MKKTIITMIMIMLFLIAPVHAYANNTDLDVTITWVNSHYSAHNIAIVNYGEASDDNNTIYVEKVKTKAMSKNKGKIIGTNDFIKYPKKVKKGKKYTVYMVYDDFDLIAVICCGKVKSNYKDVQVNCPNCNGYDRDCVYWIHNENRHMTEDEISDFEFWEAHYVDENGNIIER